jgi:hypothetical protein
VPHNLMFGITNHITFGILAIFGMMVVAAALWWLTAADRRADQAARDEQNVVSLVDEATRPTAEARTWIKVRRAGLAGLLIGSAAFFVYAWRAQHPSGLMSIDDSGYALLALLDWRALSNHGLVGLVAALTTNESTAPLVPLLASPLTALNSMSTATALVQIPFIWLLIVSADSLYRRVATPSAAFIGALVTAFLPGILIYSRLVHFAVPLTAVLTAALAALLASRHLTSWRWALIFGALTGLALLTRTIAIAMVPGLLCAAVAVSIRRTPVRVWVPNLAVAVAAAALVAGPWYLANFSAVFDRLIGLGVADSSVLNAHQTAWFMRVVQITGQDFFIPLSVVAIGIVVVGLARWILSRGTRPTLIDGATVAVAVTVGWYFVSLLTGNNSGTAFTLPLAPLFVALVLHVGSHLGRRQAVVAAAIALAITAVNVAAAIVPVGHVGVGDVTGVGDFGIVDGRSASDAQLMAALGTRDAAVSDPVALGQALHRANCDIAARAKYGPILLTRSDAVLGGVFYCAESVYDTQAFMYGPGCGFADTSCIEGVINRYGFPTVITGSSAGAYPGSMPEEAVLPALKDYHKVEEIVLAPGIVVRIWGRNDSGSQAP